MLNASQTKIRCRQIHDEDIGAVVTLLAKGFPERSPLYWRRGLERLGERTPCRDSPRYGYLLESEGLTVGVILLLCTSRESFGETGTRCNLSSWYAEPDFRSHASLLISLAIRRKEVTYVNISPAPPTRPIVEAHGFTRYSSGQFLALAALGRGEAGVRMKRVAPITRSPETALPQSPLPEAQLLSEHAAYGCVSLVCEAVDGPHPFVFMPIRARTLGIGLPAAQLVYCRSIDEFVRFSGVLGRYLLKRGMLFVALDANGPVDGLIGSFRSSWGPKYVKGPNPPRLGDLAYTELVIFGP